MGCSASQLNDMKAKALAAADAAAAAGGVQLNVPGEQGAFAPHGDASQLTLDVLIGDEKADGKKTGTMDAELDSDMNTRHATSTKVKNGFGVTREDNFSIRVNTGGDGLEKLSKMKTKLDGLSTGLGAADDLSVMLVTYMPLNAPCGLYKDSAKCDGKSIKPLVIQPDCRLVDVYMTVDGKKYEDTKFCCGEHYLENKDAMKKATDMCYEDGMEAMCEMIKRGAQSATKPWVTLFSKYEFKNENYVFLPLKIPDGADVDSIMVDQVKQYGEGILAAWAKLCHQVGAGSHKFEMTISPRCVINPEAGSGDGYKVGKSLIEGYGKLSEPNCDSSPGDVLRCDQDKKFNAFCKEWEGKDIVPPDGLFKSTFTLDLDPAVCTGKGPERVADKFAEKFNDDLEEHCQIAFDLAGAASGYARTAFGKSPGKPAHIVIPERNDTMAGCIFTSKDDKKGDEYRHYLAVAFWLHPDGDDESEGCSSLMYLKRYDARNWKPVPNPKFEVITPGTEWGVNGHDQRIKNSQIKKAIARDVDYWNVP